MIHCRPSGCLHHPINQSSTAGSAVRAVRGVPCANRAQTGAGLLTSGRQGRPSVVSTMRYATREQNVRIVRWSSDVSSAALAAAVIRFVFRLLQDKDRARPYKAGHDCHTLGAPSEATNCNAVNPSQRACFWVPTLLGPGAAPAELATAIQRLCWPEAIRALAGSKRLFCWGLALFALQPCSGAASRRVWLTVAAADTAKGRSEQQRQAQLSSVALCRLKLLARRSGALALRGGCGFQATSGRHEPTHCFPLVHKQQALGGPVAWGESLDWAVAAHTWQWQGSCCRLSGC